MKKFTLAIIICLLLVDNSSFAQMVGTNIYLQGHYLEIGQNDMGAFGASTPPVGYHPYPAGPLAEVYDYGHDGWTVGTPAYFGDYTYPGTPNEGWAIQVNDSSDLNWAFTDNGAISGTGSLTGHNISYSNSGGVMIASWAGTTAGGQLAINMQTEVDTNASWVVMTVKLYNMGSTALNNIYYLRNCEPNNDETHSGNYSTTYTISYQNDIYNRVMISTTGTEYTNAFLGLAAKDSRARAFWIAAWPIDYDGISLSTLYADITGSHYIAGAGGTGDNAVGLVYDIGTIAAGDSTTITYTYIFNGVSGIDSVFKFIQINAVSLSTCSTYNDTLSCSGFGFDSSLYQWQSSSDSITWSNISGATNATYIISGLAATTYYRMCDGSDTSSGLKITYLPTCCSGTPPVGVTSVSTTSCSSCSLTLNLAGYPVLAGLTFQWQSSPDSATWTNIPGATQIPYTFTPYSTDYYRCEVNCIPSSSTSYSPGTEVLYYYRIIAQNVTNTPATSCGGSDFYTEANGISPLLRVKTWYGDNTTDSIALTSDTTTSSTTINHLYSYPGHYTVKQILYWNNIPQDSVTFSYEYFYCRTLTVKFYNDLNLDCIKNSSEPYNSIPILIQVDSNNIPADTISVTSGLYYQELGTAGTIYSFNLLPGPYIASCASAAILYDTIVATVNTYPVKYYGLSCSGSEFDLAVSEVMDVTGPHDQYGTVYVWNNLCDSQDATITVKYSNKYSSGFNMRSGPSPISTTDSSATWYITGVSSNISPSNFCYQVWAPGGALASGDTVYTHVSVSPTSGDINIYNNTDIVLDTINDCTDPNNMAVAPWGCVPADTTQLKYKIHFTNVGTDTAFNVYVMDTLPASIDAQSLRLIMASNTMNLAMLNDGINNIVKFDFPGINLLDTSECPGCGGAVIFTVNTVPGLPTGTTILNHAGIFFDDNLPVLTNTVEDIMGGCATASTSASNLHAGSSIQVFPNPATNQLTIQMNLGAYNLFTISNSIGQQMIQQPLSLSQTNVNVSALAPGLYYITFRGDNGTTVQKFVKM